MRLATVLLLLAAASNRAVCSPVPDAAASPSSTVRLALLRRQQPHGSQQRRKRDPFSAQLYNDEGSEYLVQIGIGTPPQNFTVTLDTGSADLWVPSSTCPVSQCPYTRFDESASSTAKATSNAFNVVYGIGSVNGTYVTDTVTIGGVSVQNQQFGLASSSSDILTNPTVVGGSAPPSTNGAPVANGILGLGYPALTASASKSGSSYNPFVFNLVAQNLIQQHVFSVYMNSASADGWAGEVIFGGVDSSKYTGNITYIPVAQMSTSSVSTIPIRRKRGVVDARADSYYYWMVNGQGAQVLSKGGNNNNNNNNDQVSLAPGSIFIIDTGTTLTYFPTNIANQLASALVGPNNYALDASSQTYLVECKQAVRMGTSLELQMSDSSSASSNPLTITVPVSQLVIPLDSNSVDTAMSCMLGIAPLGSNSPGGPSASNMILVGDSVLRTAYLVFDIGNNRIGFATANNVGGTVNGVGTSSAALPCLPLPTTLLVALAIVAGSILA